MARWLTRCFFLINLQNLHPKMVAPPRMLDIGFGNGQNLCNFADAGYQTTGVDFSEKMCELGRKTSPKSEIICGDILNLTFPTGHFDVISMISLACQFPPDDARRLLQKVKTWLKPDGCIYISTSVEDNEKSGIFPKTTIGFSELADKTIARFRTNYTLDSFVNLIESSGFEILIPFLIQEPLKLNRIFQGYICHPQP